MRDKKQQLIEVFLDNLNAKATSTEHAIVLGTLECFERGRVSLPSLVRAIRGQSGWPFKTIIRVLRDMEAQGMVNLAPVIVVTLAGRRITRP